MAWDLATARLVAGIPPGDTTKDAALTRIMGRTLAAVETLLGRGLLLRRETVRFYEVDERKVLLPRYPVRRVYSINGTPGVIRGLLHHRTGWLELGPYDHWGTQDGAVLIDYEGGFDPLPDDLEAALWEALLYLWGMVDQTTGLPRQGAGAGVVQGSGDISRITLADFGSISYDVGTQVTSSESSGAGAVAEAMWGWLAPWASVLSTYRSEAAPSIAFA